ncbi:hypothetical protein B0A55_08755 [Friedmanniomyces simplex]|uniref:Uncharacterized protein n=1 Tax=Friedmanniomyces simplex TaxID=329884 RepID=A0A4U0WXS5_9PEZI|nr:hypothetical protein B0A55_08755 [Friedmanniomyces simplex]
MALKSLLYTCGQIRYEAQGIFLHENHFYTTVYNLHYTVPRTHWFHLVPHRNMSAALARGTVMRWRNLRGWVVAYHAGGATRPEVEVHEAPECYQVVAKAFEVVDRLGDGVSWAEVGEVLVELLEGYQVGKGFGRGM